MPLFMRFAETLRAATSIAMRNGHRARTPSAAIGDGERGTEPEKKLRQIVDMAKNRD
jgi:hypothetical protein